MAKQGAVGDGQSVELTKLAFNQNGSVDVADPEVLFLGDYSRHGNDLFIEHGGKAFLVEDYFAGGGALVAPSGAALTFSVVEALAGPLAPGQYAQAGGASAGGLVEIGKVVSLDGSATATHSDGVTVNLANGDPVYQGDVIQTGAASKLGVSFIDDSVFSMSADARMVLNELIFDPAKAQDSSMVVNLVQGSFVFVTGQVAPAGDMQVQTPVATMGIRGTTPLVNINTLLGVTDFSILPDPGTGRVGSYVLLDNTTGALLATVDAVGDKWVVNSLTDEVVRVAKSALELQDDDTAVDQIGEAVSRALGRRTELNGSNSYQNAANESSGEDDVLADPLGADTTGSSGSGSGSDSGLSTISELANLFDEAIYEPIVADRPATSVAYVSPTALNDAFTASDGEVLGGNVISGSGGGADQGSALSVTQVNGEPLTFLGDTASVLLPANADQQTVGALLVIGRSGGIVYDPSSAFQYLAVGEYRIDSFTYTVSDGSSSSVATVDIRVEGRNDAPEIVAPPAVATVAESGEPGGEFAGDALTGTLAFTDVDISDAGHTYRVLGVVETPLGGAPENPLGGPALLAMLDTSGSSDPGPSGTVGTIVWTFTGDQSAFDYLAEGESVRLAYTIEVTDPHGATATQTVTITIVGANDDGANAAPVISIDTSGPVPDTAAADLSETDTGLAASGTLTATDVDPMDALELSVLSVAADGETAGLGVENAALRSFLSLSPQTVLGDPTSTSEKFTWTFDSGSTAFDYLGDGESLVLTYTLQADDGGASDVETVTITIAGTNDDPEISGSDLSGSVTEPAGTTGTRTDTGTISFADVDLGDAHVVSASPDGPVLGNLTAAKTADTTGMGTGGQVTWTYTVAASAINYLSAGETKVEHFTVTIDDGHGGVISETVTVTITGTNDGPVVAAGDVTGSVSEPAPDASPVDALTDTGTIGFTDVDLGDGHAIDLITPSSGALGTLTAEVTADTTGTGTGGQIAWTYSVDPADVDYLAAGETKVETFVIRLNDGHGGTVQRTVTVTINGSDEANQPPLLTIDASGETVEDATQPLLSASGDLFFTDADAADTHTVDAELVAGSVTWSGGDVSSVLTPSEIDALTAGFSAQDGGWDYSVSNALVQFLAAGETLTLQYAVSVTDDGGASDVETVTITIAGTNDDPEISGSDLSGSVTEPAGTTGTRTDTGTISFADVDLGDAHVVSASPDGPVLGNLTAAKTADTTGMGTGGQVTWTYTVAASAINYLSAGETKVEHFTVTIDDGHGGVISETVTVTITGTNDGPVVAAGDVTGSVSEPAPDASPVDALTDTGTIGFTDVDLGDGHAIDLITPSSGALGTLTAEVTADTTGTGTGGQIAWTYSVDPADVDYLAAGETKVETFVIRLNDGHGGTVQRTVTVTINGSDEANQPPLLTIDASGETVEDATQPLLSASGDLFFTDADAADTHTVDAELVAGSVTWSGGDVSSVLTPSEIDALTAGFSAQDGGWDYSVSNALVQFLAAGETLTLQYAVSVTDDGGASDVETVTITIAGTNDDPEISGSDLSGSVTEPAGTTGTRTDTGTISFADVDLGDAHVVSASPDGPVLGNLTAAKTADTTGMGTGGQVTWTYTVAASAINYLSAGETKVEHFTVTIDDGHGGVISETVTVTITGTNDGPVVAAGDVTGSVSEPAPDASPVDALTDTGTIGFTDVDLGDGHAIDLITPSSGALGTLTAEVTADTTGTGTGGQIAWTYSVDPADVDYLAAGETKVETFVIRLNDGHGGTVQRTVTVTVAGANDVPVLEVRVFDSDGRELEETNGGLSTSGTLTVTDADLSDQVTVSVQGVDASGATTGLGSDNASLLSMFGVPLGPVAADSDDGNNLIWTFNSGSEMFGYLGVGESLALTYTVRTTDGSAAYDEQTVTITVTGTNDAPEISAAIGADSGAVAEDGAFLADGSLSFTDVDFTDTPTISDVTSSFTGVDAHGDAFVLTADQQEALDNAFQAVLGGGSANSGTIDWRFDLYGVDLSFLGQDEVVNAVFTVTLSDGHGGTDTHDIAVTINGAGSGDRDDVLYGTVDDDTLFGGLGNDTLYGLAGSDELIGGDGNDTLVGAEGDDYMAGGEGADTYDGGVDNPDESDGISFRDEVGVLGVVVDLAAGTATDTYGNEETLTGIEDVDGSDNDDTLTGNAAHNYFSGRGGADHYDGGEGTFDQVSFQDETGSLGVVVNLATGTGTDTYGNSETFVGIEVLRGSQNDDDFTGDANDNTFRGLAGADTMDGGDGWDTVRYDRDVNAGGVSGVVVDLAAHTATDGFGDTDTLFNIENVFGTDTDDTITGDEEDNELIGLGGNDTLNGGGGWDYLEGGEGDDTLNGGEGDDYLVGGEGSDTYDGGGAGPDQYDAISFRDETGALGVNINLAAGTATDTYGNSETFTGIEEVDGSQNDDTITGDDGDNYFRGFAGSDDIDGGDGWDTVSYEQDHVNGGTSGVTVNLASGHATDGFGDTDTLTGIEGVHGSAFGDTLTGNGNDNEFVGYAGDDTIHGGGGQDTVRYDQDIRRGGENGVVVNLSANTATDGFGDADTMFSIENVHGTRFDDDITGNGQNNELSGDDGNDVLTGGGGDDYLEGGDGDDQLFGGQGEDYLAGGAGVDSYDGGTGPDQFDAISFRDETGSGGAIVNLATGYVQDTYGNEEVATGIEEVDGSQNDDSITGNDDDNFFRGFDGADSYDGGEGFDQVAYDAETGGQGVVVNLSEGTGTDTFGNAETFVGIESVRGSQWADTLIGNDNSYNVFRGMAGNDIIDGGGGEGWGEVRYDRDVNRGGNSGVTVNLYEGYAIDGFGDTDTLFNINAARGSQFDDILTGNGNSNELMGMGGDDILDGGDESNSDGGDEWDTAAYWNAQAGIVVDMRRGQAVDDGDGGTDTLINIEHISGSQHADTIIGNWEDNSFYGAGGDDLLIGGGGYENLDGGNGNDRIDGGLGDDYMVGGAGADIFYMAPGTGSDFIQDFNVADGDLIDLQPYGFTSVLDFYSFSYVDDGFGTTYTIVEFNGVDRLTLYGVDLTVLPDPNAAFIFSGPLNLIQGTDGDDVMSGTSGNDLILPGQATSDIGDEIYASLGSDEIDFTGADVGGGYYGLSYGALDQYTDLTVTIGETSGTIIKSGIGTDTLTNVSLIDGEQGGLGIYAGDGNDSFTVDISGVEDFELEAGGGNNSLFVSGTGFVTVSSWSYDGIVVDANLTTGTLQEVSGSATLDITGFVNQWRGTSGNDSFTGNGGNERFVTNGGENTVDGGDGFDTVRYDRDQVSNLSIVYSAQGAAIVTGLWAGQAFADTLTNVEEVRGARFGVTQFVGSAGDERFEIHGGINFFEGGGGSDTIARFNVGTDRIDLSAYGFNDLSGFTVTFHNVGNGYSTIDLGGGDTITVLGVDLVQGVDPAQVFILNGNPGTSGNDMLVGTADADVLRSGGQTLDDTGSDNLDGGAGDDLLVAEGGFVNMVGGQGNDVLVAVRANDDWDSARADYAASPDRIVANLGTAAFMGIGSMQIADGYGTTDTVSGIHSILDSAGDDYVRVDGSYRNSSGSNGLDVRLTGGDDTVDFTGAGSGVRINYRDAADGVIVNLADGTAVDANLLNGDDIGADTLINVNSARGSDFDDMLIGNDGDNRLRGHGGDDLIDGAGGRDRAEYANSETGIVIDMTLSSGQVIDDGLGGADTLIDIEVIAGSDHADTMTGDDNDNEFRGELGDDVLYGGAGWDTLVGDFGDGLLGGNDQLFGEAGDDALQGGSGDDILSGGDGYDSLEGGEGYDEFVLQSGETGVDQILDFGADNNAIILTGFGYTASVSLVDNGFGGGNLMVDSQIIAQLQDYSSQIAVDYDALADQHTVTMYSV